MMKFLFSVFLLLSSIFASFGQLLNEGSLVKAGDNDSIYLVFNRELHHVPDVHVYSKLFRGGARVDIRRAMDLQTLPKGSPLVAARLVKDEFSAVYLTFDRYKVHIGNPYTFDLFQFDWGKVLLLSYAEIAQFITIRPLELHGEGEVRPEYFDCGVH